MVSALRFTIFLRKRHGTESQHRRKPYGTLDPLKPYTQISAFAPPLDEAGNSVKAQAVMKSFVNKLGLGIFNGNRVSV